MKQVMKKKSPGNQQRIRLAIFLLLTAAFVGALFVSRDRDAVAKSLQQKNQRARQTRQQNQMRAKPKEQPRAKPTGQPIVQAEFGPDRPLLPVSNIVSESSGEPGESIVPLIGRSKPQPPRGSGGSGEGNNQGGE